MTPQEQALYATTKHCVKLNARLTPQGCRDYRAARPYACEGCAAPIGEDIPGQKKRRPLSFNGVPLDCLADVKEPPEYGDEYQVDPWADIVPIYTLADHGMKALRIHKALDPKQGTKTKERKDMTDQSADQAVKEPLTTDQKPTTNRKIIQIVFDMNDEQDRKLYDETVKDAKRYFRSLHNQAKYALVCFVERRSDV